MNTRFGWEVISKEPTCLRRQVSEAIRIKESRDKESLQRDQIINQYLAEPKPEPEPNLKPKPEPNQPENLAQSKPNKTKPEPPPEEYIFPLLTHINLNDKLEYNRSTIPSPDDKPPTENEIRIDKKVKATIETLRTEYQRLQALAKTESESQMKTKTKAKRKTKQKQTLTNEPNPLTMILNGNIDFDKVSKMRDTKIDDLLVKYSMNPDMDLDLEWRRLNKINWNDIDLDLDNIDLTNDHLHIGHDYNGMTELELGYGG